ncbi:MAG: ATP-binding protein [Gammaproteobacteria bacterium]|nr:ATP-binding protein [Gammaproteobacteria bacterium]
MSFWERFLPPSYLNHQRSISLYLEAYRSLLVLAGFIVSIIPIYAWVRGSLTWDETVALMVAVLAPFIGILCIRLSGNLVLGMLLTTALTTAVYFDLAYHTGGLTSFVIPWFITNLAVQGLFGSRKALAITYGILMAEFLGLLILENIGLLPENTTPPEHIKWGFALSLVTAISAMTWVGSITLKSRKLSKHKLKEARIKAEAANQSKSRFLSSMSHELRTPMNAIMGFAQIIGSDPKNPPTESQSKAINHILQSGDHLMALLNQILDLAKIESGKIVLSIKKVSLFEIGQECLALVDKQAATSNLRLENNLTITHAIKADRTRFKQILLNLISNAIKYNQPDGSVTLTSKVTADNLVRITVSDTGVGIAQDQYAMLFQPFNRLGKEAGNIEGTGIGLTITRQLVEVMDGRIGFESKPGKGSSFWIELPEFDNPDENTIIQESFIQT